MWPTAAWRTAGRWGGLYKVRSCQVDHTSSAARFSVPDAHRSKLWPCLTLGDTEPTTVRRPNQCSQLQAWMGTLAHNQGIFSPFFLSFFFFKHISIIGGLLVHLQHNQAYPDILIVVFHHPVIYRTRQMGRWLSSCKRTPPVAHRHRPRWRSLRRGAEAAAAQVRPVHQPGDPQQRTFLPSDLRGWFGQLKLVPHRCGECLQSRRRRRMERVSELREGG